MPVPLGVEGANDDFKKILFLLNFDLWLPLLFSLSIFSLSPEKCVFYPEIADVLGVLGGVDILGVGPVDIISPIYMNVEMYKRSMVGVFIFSEVE